MRDRTHIRAAVGGFKVFCFGRGVAWVLRPGRFC
jgi:hypothetical protein